MKSLASIGAVLCIAFCVSAGGHLMTDKRIRTNPDHPKAEAEAEGPLGEDFQTTDTNKDGFVTLEELKNASKPKIKK